MNANRPPSQPSAHSGTLSPLTWVRRRPAVGIAGLLCCITLGYWGYAIAHAHQTYAKADQVMAETQSLDINHELRDLQLARNQVQRQLHQVNALHRLPGTRAQQQQQRAAQLTARLAQLSDIVTQKEAEIAAEQSAQVAFASAQNIAKQAAERVQNPPHSLEVWETALKEWTRAIELLESVAPSTTVYDTAQIKLTDYRTNYAAIAQRLEVEKAAIANYDKGRQLMDEAITLSRKSPYGLTDLQAVQTKVTQAVQAFRSIPSGAGIAVSAQNRLAAHTEDLQKVQAKVSELATCNPNTDLLQCQEYVTVRLSTFSDSTVTYGDTPVRASQSGSCDCPYDTDSRGNRCGDRSAYSRPGGSSPVCYK